MSPRAIPIVVALLAAAPAARAEPGGGPRFALHFGTGTGGWRIAGHDAWFSENLARNPLELAFSAEAAVGGARRLQGGARASALVMDAGDGATHTSVAVSRLEAFARVHPRWIAGPYLTAGLGPAFLRYRAEVPGVASDTLTSWGGSFSLALGGYVGGERAPEFRLEGEAAIQRWRATPRGPDVSVTLGATLGVAW